MEEMGIEVNDWSSADYTSSAVEQLTSGLTKSNAYSGSDRHISPCPLQVTFPSDPNFEASEEQVGICLLYAMLIAQSCPRPVEEE